MTSEDKAEIAAIIRRELDERGHCSLGIKPETAYELISFADWWKHMRRNAWAALIILIVGGLVAAVVAGFKMLIKN